MLALVALLLSPASAQEAGANLETKWMRDSIEYYTLARQVYRTGTDQVLEAADDLKKNQKWAVVLDVDETVLDNSTYQLERSAYGATFDWPSWNAWTERRAAKPVPGVKGFIDAVRGAGGQVAFITNRHVDTLDATRENLAAEGLFVEGDLLCLLTDDEAYDKVARRTEIREGTGKCAWQGVQPEVLGYFGDTIHDFPEAGEEEVDDWDSQFARRYFLLPNPMYGSWSQEVTRPL